MTQPTTPSDLENIYTYHEPKNDQPDRYNTIRATAISFAGRIIRDCPQSRERSIALTKLEEVVMWANAAIARNE